MGAGPEWVIFTLGIYVSFRSDPAVGRVADGSSVPEPEMTAASFHDLIRNRQQRGRDFETERLGGLEVDRQLELGGRLRWEIGRASALQNAVDIGSRSPSDIRDVGAVSRLSSARARMEGGSPGQGPS